MQPKDTKFCLQQGWQKQKKTKKQKETKKTKTSEQKSGSCPVEF